MATTREAAAEFLAKRRIAVTGVSRTPKSHGSNIVYQRLRARGYQVFAVNPNADEVEGDRCYHDLKSVPGSVSAAGPGTSEPGEPGGVEKIHDTTAGGPAAAGSRPAARVPAVVAAR